MLTIGGFALLALFALLSIGISVLLDYREDSRRDRENHSKFLRDEIKARVQTEERLADTAPPLFAETITDAPKPPLLHEVIRSVPINYEIPPPREWGKIPQDRWDELLQEILDSEE
jgi:hypothetical protein